MEQSGMIDKFILFGLTRQEATVYLCLLKSGGMTGYEVAKQTGISRSNVYSTLSCLVDHGAAYLIEGASSKYMAVGVEEFCENHIRRLKREMTYLVENAPKKPETVEGYITIEGYTHVMDKIHHMLTGAGQRIYFSASREFLQLWQEEIGQLLQRGIKVVLITEHVPANVVQTEAAQTENLRQLLSQGNLILYESQERKDHQIRLIVDSAHVLTGEIAGRENDNCLYCAQQNFVNVFKEAMRNEIKLIELKGTRA